MSGWGRPVRTGGPWWDGCTRVIILWAIIATIAFAILVGLAR